MSKEKILSEKNLENVSGGAFIDARVAIKLTPEELAFLKKKGINDPYKNLDVAVETLIKGGFNVLANFAIIK